MPCVAWDAAGLPLVSVEVLGAKGASVLGVGSLRTRTPEEEGSSSRSLLHCT